jgi:hypothetical protein
MRRHVSEAEMQAPHQLAVRPAAAEDVPAISAMQKASLPETYGSFLGRPAVEEFIAGGNVDRYFDENWQHASVATIGGEIVGVAALESSELTLEVWTVNGRAVAFYDRLGFSVGGTVADPATNLEKLVMRKTLRPT